MTTLTVCLVTALCLCSATALFSDDNDECEHACGAYLQAGNRCVHDKQCQQMSDDEESHTCYTNCYANHAQCRGLCEDHYDAIMATCEASCSQSSFWQFSCEDDCFKEQFKEVSSHLPNVTAPQVGIWQGVPYLGDNSAEDGDASAHLSSREEPDWSWEDEIGDWRKKREPDWSWEDDMGDRRKKREPDWSWDDDMGDRKKKRDMDWSWEDFKMSGEKKKRHTD